MIRILVELTLISSEEECGQGIQVCVLRLMQFTGKFESGRIGCMSATISGPATRGQTFHTLYL